MAPRCWGRSAGELSDPEPNKRVNGAVLTKSASNLAASAAQAMGTGLKSLHQGGAKVGGWGVSLGQAGLMGVTRTTQGFR